MFQKDCGSYLLVLFIRCLDVINWFGNKKSIWLVSLPIRFLPFGKVQLSNKELQGFQYCWPSHCWITLDNSGFDWSEEVSKEEANKKRHEYVSLVPACWTEIHGYFWFWKNMLTLKTGYWWTRFQVDSPSNDFSNQLFSSNHMKPAILPFFPLSWYVLVIIGSVPLIPNGERWESLWQMQIWKHREWWATWILGSLWNPNKPERYLHLFISYIFLGMSNFPKGSQFIGWIWGSFRRFGLVT